MKYIGIILLILISCSQRSEKTHQGKESIITDSIKPSAREEVIDTTSQEIPFIDSLLEEKIVDKIFKLKEIKEFGKKLRANTNGESGVTIIVRGDGPMSPEKYYWAQVGYSSPLRFETHFNFYIEKRNLDIYFYDTVHDELLSLKEWRSQTKNTKPY
jgi:hypothetical protein